MAPSPAAAVYGAFGADAKLPYLDEGADCPSAATRPHQNSNARCDNDTITLRSSALRGAVSWQLWTVTVLGPGTGLGQPWGRPAFGFVALARLACAFRASKLAPRRHLKRTDDASHRAAVQPVENSRRRHKSSHPLENLWGRRVPSQTPAAASDPAKPVRVQLKQFASDGGSVRDGLSNLIGSLGQSTIELAVSLLLHDHFLLVQA